MCMNIVNLHACKLRLIPRPRQLGMRVKQHTPVVHDLLAEQFCVGPVAEHNAGSYSEWHDSLFHLKPGNKQFALVQTSPLPIETRATINAMIAQADEVQPRALQHTEDRLE